MMTAEQAEAAMKRGGIVEVKGGSKKTTGLITERLEYKVKR